MSLANFQNQSSVRNKVTFFCAIVVLLGIGLACEQNRNANVEVNGAEAKTACILTISSFSTNQDAC